MYIYKGVKLHLLGSQLEIQFLASRKGATKTSFEGDQAMEQFWKNPELEMLLTFPNEKMNLAQALIFNIHILQGPLVWN